MVKLYIYICIIAFGNNWLKRSVLAACNICIIKTIIYIEVQKYPFGFNGLKKKYTWNLHSLRMCLTLSKGQLLISFFFFNKKPYWLPNGIK